MSRLRFRPLVHCVLRLATVLFVLVPGCLDRPVSRTDPVTTNILIEPVRLERIERIDLLFMIDNSQSMADKQAILASAVPQLVRRLVQPRCLDAAGNAVASTYPCPAGSSAEFQPVTDIHVGVVSSSLGAHGGEVCQGGAPLNDAAHLIPSVRVPAPASDGNGFLWWNPGDDPFGDAEVSAFADRFQAHVQAAGEDGCGFEASLESWYRFLVDPAPPAQVVKQGNQTLASGRDEVLLQQRQDFLRPDSLVAIVMLSDENDCSIRDSDVGWYVSSEAALARPTSACENDPNDPCCRSCAIDESAGPPAGCKPLCDDPACQPECQQGKPALIAGDQLNLRCHEQKRRYGIDFLYPTRRYVNALSKTWLCPGRADLDPDACPAADRVKNPLFSGATRTPELVFFAGIVGVPWQDIATAGTLASPGELDYMSARELHESGRWAWITPTDGAPPSDPLMRESTEPRQGAHPSGDPALAPAPPESPATANAANGHEWRPNDLGGGNPSNAGDLQYACTFPLAAQDSCAGDPLCDCFGAGQAGYSQNKPLCQTSAGYSDQQVAAKGYPGLRQLEVLRDFGDNSIVASICPKVLDDHVADYGYNPAVDAIVDRLADVLVGRCLPRQLAIEDGVVPCKIVESFAAEGACDCTAPGREPVSADIEQAARRQLDALAACGPDSPSGVACDSICLCSVAPYAGDALVACQTQPSFEPTEGWCYVDPGQDHPAPNPGTEALVQQCATHERRLLRFEPRSGATALLACQGAAVSASGQN